jgi:excisionase family DNA binding protein
MSDTLTTRAAAAVLGVSEQTLRNWADDRKIRHVRLPSGQLRFRREDLDEALTPVEPATAGPEGR